MVRYLMASIVCAATLGAQMRSIPSPKLTAQIAAAERRVAQTRPRTVADAEAEGANYPRVSSTAPSARTCTTIRPEQIVFPTTRAVNPYLQSGDFDAVSISFGWDQTYEQAKLPLRPYHPDAIGAGVRIRMIRLDQPGQGPTFSLAGFNATSIGDGYQFFASWPLFPTPGQWMLLVTAGANWGCFVLDRPVK